MMFISFFKNLFKKRKTVNNLRRNLNSYTDSKTKKETKSSVFYDRNNNRFLKLDNNDVALVMHPGNVVEVVLTKMTDKNKAITPEEDLAMSLALFLKQKEFCELLTHTFHDLAMRNVGPYNDKLEEK